MEIKTTSSYIPVVNDVFSNVSDPVERMITQNNSHNRYLSQNQKEIRIYDAIKYHAKTCYSSNSRLGSVICDIGK